MLPHRVYRRFMPLARHHEFRRGARDNANLLTMHWHFDKDGHYQFRCEVCLRPDWCTEESPVLREDLWKRVAGETAAIICLPCLKKKLGRPFTTWDFKWPRWDTDRLPSILAERRQSYLERHGMKCEAVA